MKIEFFNMTAGQINEGNLFVDKMKKDYPETAINFHYDSSIGKIFESKQSDAKFIITTEEKDNLLTTPEWRIGIEMADTIDAFVLVKEDQLDILLCKKPDDSIHLCFTNSKNEITEEIIEKHPRYTKAIIPDRNADVDFREWVFTNIIVEEMKYKQ